jgi:hypothetical protein
MVTSNLVGKWMKKHATLLSMDEKHATLLSLDEKTCNPPFNG